MFKTATRSANRSNGRTLTFGMDTRCDRNNGLERFFFQMLAFSIHVHVAGVQAQR